MNSIQFLDTVREMHEIPSDNKLSKYLGVSQPHIAQIRTGKRKIDDALALSVAKSLDLPPTYVMASIQAERAKCTEVRTIWANLARTVSGRNGLNLMAFLVLGFSSVQAIGVSSMSIYCILCKVRSRIENGWTDRAASALYGLSVLAAVVAVSGLTGCGTTSGVNRAEDHIPSSQSYEPVPGHRIRVVRVDKICPGNQQSESYRRCKGW